MHALQLLMAQSNHSGGGEAAVGGIFFMLCMCFSAVIGLLSFVLWIWMLIDCATNEPSQGNDKVIWILVIVLLQGLGALIYFLVRRPARIRQLGK